MTPVEVIFWISAFLLVYPWVIYPLILVLAARLFARPVKRGDCGEGVSVIIAAHNEAGKIAAKLKSLIASDTRNQVREIFVGTDGATDGTGDVVRSVGDGRIQLIEFSERRGKPSVLNDLAAKAAQPILLFTDARQELAADALEKILMPFADADVGVVSGELVFRLENQPGAAGRGMDAYWRLEKFIRKAESRIGSVPGATGAFYAMRREFFAPVPPDTLLDDVLIPMCAVQAGKRCLIEEGAIVWDLPSREPKAEYKRKLRTMMGNIQLLRRHPRWWLPGGSRGWFVYFSHKVIRLFMPHLLALVAVANVLLLNHEVYRWIGVVHALFYALALFGWGASRLGRAWGPAGKAYMFLAMAGVIGVAWFRSAFGRYDARWGRSLHENAKRSSSCHGK